MSEMTESKVYEIFPQLIQKFKFDGDTDLLKNTINGIRNFTSTDTHEVGFNFLEKYKEDYAIIKEFLEFSEKCAKIYAEETLKYNLFEKDVVCTNSWVNFFDSTDAFMSPHLHTNSIISSNYFLNYHPTFHAPLVFANNKDISHNLFMSQSRIGDQIDGGNFDVFTMKFEEGDIIFWSSNIYHYVPHSRQIGRATIAQNYMPEVVNNGGYSFRVSKV